MSRPEDFSAIVSPAVFQIYTLIELSRYSCWAAGITELWRPDLNPLLLELLLFWERHCVELSYASFPLRGRTNNEKRRKNRNSSHTFLADTHPITSWLLSECKVNHRCRQYLCQTLWPWRIDGRFVEPWQQSSVNPTDEKSVFVFHANWLVNFCDCRENAASAMQIEITFQQFKEERGKSHL